ncbi:PilX N-terminal domain-containing pilus assembly protein [Desulfobotulus sp. H1]|uniref:PilX N-terminal domain-containing pilus assembly protein n=1 Tax=Desulfobotulus pelophilus TaxID=2823377 RepID=A0ABT3NCP4_9BACT|nr:PilX N-terminal domain-containing pilus assembly protein [Desulfobotulus pelophilus]MCW7755245.1 PilX N-terminal domain-containing pilus assembly protein [Desulfobotulus pelophilus]
MIKTIHSVSDNEKGIILITSLVLLVILTLIGIAAMQSTTLQERMAGNMEQRDRAFQAAESGLRAAEARFAAWGINPPAFNGQDGRYHSVSSPLPADWWLPARNPMQDADSNAVFIIEEVRSIEDAGANSIAFVPSEDFAILYRIRSRAQSPNTRATVMLETTFVY